MRGSDLKAFAPAFVEDPLSDHTNVRLRMILRRLDDIHYRLQIWSHNKTVALSR